MKIVALNKKASHDYEILDRFEAGIVLTGDEVKSLRAGRVSLIGAFATIKKGELYLNNCNITPYDKAFLKKKRMRRVRESFLCIEKSSINLLAKCLKRVSRSCRSSCISTNEILPRWSLGLVSTKKQRVKSKRFANVTLSVRRNETSKAAGRAHTSDAPFDDFRPICYHENRKKSI